MKKKFYSFILVCLLCLISTDSSIFSNSKEGKSMLGFKIGGHLPLGDQFKKGVLTGVNFIHYINEEIRVKFEVGYLPSRTQIDPDGFYKGDFSTIPIQLTLQYPIPIGKKWCPYFGIGTGLYLNKFKLENEEEWEQLGYQVNEEVKNGIFLHTDIGIDYFFNSRFALNIGVRLYFFKLSGSYSILHKSSGVLKTDDFISTFNPISLEVGLSYHL